MADSSALVPGGSAVLDLYTNKSPNRGCPNASKTFALRSSDGVWAPMPCRLNSCLVCYRMKSFERAQMVYLDALVEAPRYALTFTTLEPVWNAAVFREGRRQVQRSLRDRFGRWESLDFIEQTTGKAPRSGGHKRGHAHSAAKCDEPGAVLEIESIIVPIWKRITGAWQVNVAELASAGGTLAYLTLNLALEKGKAAQAPVDLPKGTRTLRASRGYWSRPVADLRVEAREHNAMRRFSWALEQEGASPELVAEAVELESLERRLRTWEVRRAFDHPTLGWQDRGPMPADRSFDWSSVEPAPVCLPVSTD